MPADTLARADSQEVLAHGDTPRGRHGTRCLQPTMSLSGDKGCDQVQRTELLQAARH